jgi:hypothetical protein
LKVFLNGLLDPLVALTPPFNERVRGWQAFFSLFFKVF